MTVGRTADAHIRRRRHEQHSPNREPITALDFRDLPLSYQVGFSEDLMDLFWAFSYLYFFVRVLFSFVFRLFIATDHDKPCHVARFDWRTSVEGEK